MERLVNENVALAHYFAAKNSFRMDRSDGLSIAFDALLRAAKAWEPGRIKFGTYASLLIKWGFSSHFLAARALRRGRGIPDLSIDAPISISDDDDRTISGRLLDPNPTPDEAALAEDTAADLRRKIAAMDPRTQEILSLRFGLEGGEPQTLDEISRRFEITRERIRQIESKTLKRLGFLTKAHFRFIRRKRKPGRLWKPPPIRNDLWRPENATAEPVKVRARARRAPAGYPKDKARAAA